MPVPPLRPALRRLVEWTADYYCAPPSAVLRMVIASGGASTPQHLLEAFQAGADAVLAATMFHSGEYTVAQAKRVVADGGIPVRL